MSSLPYTSIAIVPRVVIHSLGAGKREAGEEGWSNKQGLLGDLRDLGFNTTYMNLFGKTQKSNPLALTCKCIDNLISLRKTSVREIVAFKIRNFLIEIFQSGACSQCNPGQAPTVTPSLSFLCRGIGRVSSTDCENEVRPCGGQPALCSKMSTPSPSSVFPFQF